MRQAVCLLLLLAGCNRPANSGAGNEPASEQSAPVQSVAVPTPPPEEPGARAARSLHIRQDAKAIQAECQRAAGGDWQKWQQITACYRDELQARITELRRNNSIVNEVLAGRDLPIFHARAGSALNHVIDPEEWRALRKNRALVAASRWLHQRGIDMIFVGVPSMPEVYIEQFINHAPPDGIIAPHLRQAYLELLRDDVEIVNTFPILREGRADGFQYLPVDHHWNQRGMRRTVSDIAMRISRYSFGRDAKSAPAITRSRSGPYAFHVPDDPAARMATTLASVREDQWQAALRTLPPTMDFITSPDGSAIADDPRSPILIIGNSFAMHFRELLIRETNLQLRTGWTNGGTSGAFDDFLRLPEKLDGVRVIVWVTSNQFVAPLKAMPKPILNILDQTE
jgi:hypothetical protein